MSFPGFDDLLSAMCADGAGPASASDLKADGKRRYYRLEGDRPGQTKASCQITELTPGFWAARWSNFRTGRHSSWHTRREASAPASPEDRAAWTRQAEERDRADEAERIETAANAARKAASLWARLANADGSEPYLRRKGVPAIGVKKMRDVVIIPARAADGLLQTLQFIAGDGGKRFLTGGSAKGAYHMLGEAQGAAVILMAEGYATGAAVHISTGLPVAVAFDAGNLAPVTSALRAAHPSAALVVCRDDDQWTVRREHQAACEGWKDMTGDAPEWAAWRKKGWTHNTGRDNAMKAALGKGFVVCPGFPADDPGKRKDFNDLLMTGAWGLDDTDVIETNKNAIKIRVSAAVEQALAALPPPDTLPAASGQPVSVMDEASGVQSGGQGLLYDGPPQAPLPANAAEYMSMEPEREPVRTWRDEAIWKIIIDKKGRETDRFIDPDKSLNYSVMVKHKLAGVFVYDEFCMKVKLVRCPPWIDRDEFRVHELEDTDIIECDYWMQKYMLLNGSIEKTRQAILTNANKNRVNPAREYFDRLKWDGVPRLDNWLIDIAGCEGDEPDYLRFVGAKWMIAAVRRVRHPGCKFDHMLVIGGTTDAGKSLMLRRLATIGDKGMEEAYFTDTFSLKNLRNKDELQKFWGSLIIEIGELAGYRETDIEEIKTFITVQTDKLRRPYDILVKDFPRMFVFAATYNPTAGFLRDPTGNKRFWPVNCGDKIDIDMLDRGKEQLWAEAAHREALDESLRMNDYLWSLAAAAASERMDHDIWADDVWKFVNGRIFVTTAEVASGIGLPMQGRTRRENDRIRDIMIGLGYKYEREQIACRRVYGWKLNKPTRAVDYSRIGMEPEIVEEEIAW